MAEITARVCIDGREVDYIEGSYQNDGNLLNNLVVAQKSNLLLENLI